MLEPSPPDFIRSIRSFTHASCNVGNKHTARSDRFVGMHRHLSLHSVMSRFQFSWTSDTLERIGAASSPCFFIRRSQLASWS
ncbi:unnamed protein product, partial [Ixodes persulcatus]